MDTGECMRLIPGADAAFESALGLIKPWRLESVQVDADRGRIILAVGFARGGRFRCAACGFAAAAAYDAAPARWELVGGLAGWMVEVLARIPRARCTSCGAIRRVKAPWSSIARRARGAAQND